MSEHIRVLHQLRDLIAAKVAVGRTDWKERLDAVEWAVRRLERDCKCAENGCVCSG